MDRFQSSSVSFVRKPISGQQSSEIIPFTNGSKYQNNYFKPTYPMNLYSKSSRRPWVPNNRNDKETPISIISYKYNDSSSDNHLKQTTIKPMKCKLKLLQIFKIFLVMGIILLTLTAIAISIYTLVQANIVTTTTTTTTMSSTTSTTITTTTTTTTTSTTTTTTTVAVLPSQCYSYSFINDPSRLATAAGSTGNDYGYFTGTYAWYRIYGSSGSQITTSAPNYYACGGYYSGWYAGTMPTYGNTLTGTVCYVYTNICYWSNMILVTNCGSYYVYGLIDPPVSYGRYCTV